MLNRLLTLVLSLMLLVGAASAEDLTLTGDVFYRERMALPPGATLHVGLVALPNGQPIVGAGAAVPAGGQVPLQFSLAVRSDVAKSSGAFGLIAEIRVGGAAMWRNDIAVPVDLSAPAPVSILVTRAPIAPTPPEPELDKNLINTTWTVTSIGGSPIIGAQPLTLAIAADLRVDGHAGCNSYFTQATMDETRLQFAPPASTRMACQPDIMNQESAFFSALVAVNGYETSADSLRLLDAAAVPLIGLVRTKE
ncbi:META domain-containing protein [Devosia sp.]|uniref:META domain-containing protein n=1 Tax=Devosia sp. TaxID=1871048 RepID=UPI001B0ACFB7|nr:META domain-containing protein [Devosia sp.]MBO9587210.1 META domain-containing protein [Devosia sp.]